MNGIIITIIIYIIGTILKNLVNEGKKISPTINKTDYRNFKSYELNYEKKEEENYKVTGFKIKDIKEKSKLDIAEKESMDLKVVDSEKSETNEVSEDSEILLFNADSILNGIIMSELLSPPKALNGIRIIKRQG